MHAPLPAGSLAPPPDPRLAAEVARRRTFAIIAHPDAGKTTLTEKLLLRGGAIQLAGQVRAKGERRRTRSDWMKIEQDRGISVATSVMTFERDGIVFTLLDTPGHEDFSEDTYRTLTAVDAAVMVLDAAKGIESQTRKLFEVCRLRDIPIVTFVNKIDREMRDPLDLVDEIERTLALDATPVSWPVGAGRDLQGVYDLVHPALRLIEREGAAAVVPLTGLEDETIDGIVGDQRAAALREGAGLALAACPPFDLQRFREGTLTPVFFGSALRDFGVGHLLDGLAAMAPPPRGRAADLRTVEPEEPACAGFVFKIQANIDPNHRDRVAFLRVCSGRLQKGMKLTQVRTGKQMAINAPLFFFARDRQVAEEAWPGDVVGIANHGTLRIGDTLTEGERVRFRGVPSFAPEVLRRVKLTDPMLAKRLQKALGELAEEGVVQVFRPIDGAPTVVGVVGALQLDVLQARLLAEYQVPVEFDPVPWTDLRWVEGPEKAAAGDTKPGDKAAWDKAGQERFRRAHGSDLAEDHDGALVMFFGSDWRRRRAEEDWPALRFVSFREQDSATG